MRRAVSGSFASVVLALFLGPGCGLALDYDPPTDAGAGIDAELADVGTCSPQCTGGQICVSGTCREPAACETPTDCPPPGAGECASDCVAGRCEPRPPFACIIPASWECAEVDACVSCDPILRADRCSSDELCDVAGGYRCVECTLADTSRCDTDSPICDADGSCQACRSDRECALAGLGHACLDGRCVECTSDANCRDDAAPRCDLSRSTCVGCLSLDDCGAGQACIEGSCGACRSDGDCPRGRCAGGSCVRVYPCENLSECPRTCAGEAIACTADACIYPGTEDGACNDDVHCTFDTCNPRSPRADAFGCVFEPIHGMCGDEIGCTIDQCRPSPGTLGGDGCVHVPADVLCEGTDLGGCIEPVCVGGAATGVDAATGCMKAFVRPCRDDQICTSSGVCVDAPTCEACVDDGLACNGVERCVDGACAQEFEGTCSGECDQFCVDESRCAPRPGGVGCGIAVPAL